TIRRQDYRPYPFRVARVELTFDLDPAQTRVHSTLHLERQGAGELVLDGEELDLVSVHVDGAALGADRYDLSENLLIIKGLGEAARVEIVNHCKPDQNSTLMGLYISSDVFFTQCEAQGFRRITWF